MLNRRNFLTLTLQGVVLISTEYALTGCRSETVTPEEPEKRSLLLRFATASDGHFGQPKTPYEETHQKLIGWLNQEKINHQLDFFVVNGDLFHDKPSFLPEVKKVWDGLTMPYYVTHGNHDMVTEEVWQQTWGTPWHYAFEKGDTAFLMLNTSDIKGNYICPDVAWARETFQKYKDKKHLFVFMHITPMKWTQWGIDCPEIVALFSQQANLRGIFHGHDHAEDGYKEKNGKPYFFDSHICGSWGTAYSGYRVVEVYSNGEIETFQVNPEVTQRVNQFVIPKPVKVG